MPVRAAAAQRLGMDEAMVAKIHDFRASDLPDRIKLVLEFAEAWVLHHAQTIDEDLLDRLREHFSEAQIVELAIGMGSFESAHKFMVAFDIGPEGEGVLSKERGGIPPEFRHILDES
jgi:alkylhydroperoxidase family enzyme